MDCPDEKILSSYLDKRLTEDERQNIEEHLAVCNRCLDLLVVAHEAQLSPRKCPPVLKNKIHIRLGLKQRKSHSESKWLFSAVLCLGLSFIIRRYFLQFLVLAAILGFKWVMEGEAAKKVIMIFKGMHKEDSDIPQRPSYRNPFLKNRD